MRSNHWTPLIGLLGCLAATALAEDRPDRAVIGELAPEIQAADWENAKNPPNLDEFKHNIVVLFFFRTDDSTSTEVIPRLNQLHEALKHRGVVIIGLTPQEKDKAESVVKGKEVQFIVGYGAETQLKYSVSAFPRVFLIDPSGKLVNQFHPLDEMEERINVQIRKTPPAGADLEALKERYRRSRSAFENREYGRAYTLATDVANLAPDGTPLADAVKELLERVKEAADLWLAEARDALGNRDYDKAFGILAQLSVRFEGTSVAAEADTEIGRLLGDREHKAKINAAKKNVAAELQVDRAADYAAGGRYVEALDAYRAVIAEYRDTPAADQAEKAIEAINSDPKAQSAIAERRALEQSERWLDIADRFAKVDMHDKAREYYERIRDDYPGSRAAEKAGERLKELPRAKS